MKINLNVKDGIRVDQLEKLGTIFEGLPDGRYEVYIGKPRRTKPQNNLIHAVFEEVADHFESLGSTVKIEIAPTPTAVKEKFNQEYVPEGKTTSKCTTKELANAIDRFIRNLNTFFRENGAEEITIKNKDTINLLKTYGD